MGLLDTFAKYFLFLSNILIFILSWTIVGLGIWALVNKSSFLDLLNEADVSIPIYNSAVIIFLIVASVAVIISCLGCCGAYKEIKWMLTVYFVVVLGLLILIVVGTIIAMTQGLEALKDPLIDSLSKYDETRKTALEQTWDQTQTNLQCCGVNHPGDWAKYNERYGPTTIELEKKFASLPLIRPNVPESCCASASDKSTCMTTPTINNGAFVVGCWIVIQVEVENHVSAVGGVAIAVIIILTVNMLIAMYLCACGLDSDIDDRPRKRAYGQPSGRL